MTFLPLVTRELRAASRRKSTYHIRRWIAVAAFVVGLFFIVMGMLGSRDAGQVLFSFLTTFAVLFALLAGILFTPDCISQEKREGTLGLLFLTDLKGYDVVLGKFISRSLNAFYGLLALLPVAAISLFLGGLTGSEFWRTALALLNLLFVCLAIGVFVSALVLQSRTATGVTVLLLFLVLGILGSLAWLSTVAYVPTILTWIAYISPLYPYMWSGEIPYGTHSALFWKTLAVSHLLGWFLIGFTSWLLPRIWQEKAILPEEKGIFWRLRRKSRGSAAQRDKARQKLLPVNPILWLIGDEPAIRNTVWLMVIIWGAVIVLLSSQDPANSLWTAFVGTLILGFFFKLLVASQACRFFVESRKNGSLEMLLCTPLRNRDIIRGQWLSLKRLFLWPLIILALLNLVPIAFLVYQAFTGPGLSEALHSVPSAMASLGASCWLTFGLVADVFTVGWVGMWLGLSAKKPDLAPFWTILFVLILPLIVCPLAFLVDVFLIIWASSNLQTEIRWTLSRQYQVPSNQMTPRMALPYVPQPPVIVR